MWRILPPKLEASEPSSLNYITRRFLVLFLPQGPTPTNYEPISPSSAVLLRCSWIPLTNLGVADDLGIIWHIADLQVLLLRLLTIPSPSSRLTTRIGNSASSKLDLLSRTVPTELCVDDVNFRINRYGVHRDLSAAVR